MSGCTLTFDRGTLVLRDAPDGLARGIAMVSRLVTLEPGDLVIAGPLHAWEGPPLRDGDVVEATVTGVGRLVHHAREARRGHTS